MEIREVIWNILAELLRDADAIILDEHIAGHDLPGAMQFANDLRLLMVRLTTGRRLSAASLEEKLVQLRLRCPASLPAGPERIDRTIRRARALSQARRGRRAMNRVGPSPSADDR